MHDVGPRVFGLPVGSRGDGLEDMLEVAKRIILCGLPAPLAQRFSQAHELHHEDRARVKRLLRPARCPPARGPYRTRRRPDKPTRARLR